MEIEQYNQKHCPANRVCQCHRNGDGICLLIKHNNYMEEKFKLIESKKELFAEISVATKREFGTIKNHWFNPVNIPEKHQETVNKLLDRRLEYQKASKKLHEKYFGN